VQLDEPVFALDLNDAKRLALSAAYARLSGIPGIKIMVASYFGTLEENLQTFAHLPVPGLHVDAVRGEREVIAIANAMGEKVLSVGIVDGRNIWKNDFTASLNVLNRSRAVVGDERLIIASSCSLLHVPLGLEGEGGLDAELKNWMAFAEEKLLEVHTLAGLLDGTIGEKAWQENQAAIAGRRKSGRIHNAKVTARAQAVRPADLERKSVFAKRRLVQKTKLNLPDFPTTTIGSFPQTIEVRAMRARLKAGHVDEAAYEQFLEGQVREAVAFQEETGIDMLCTGNSSATTWWNILESNWKVLFLPPTAGCKAMGRGMLSRPLFLAMCTAPNP